MIKRPPQARVAVSATTRPARRAERDGREYYFLSERQFDRAEADGRLLESATYAGHRYGTLADELMLAPHTIIECDVRGVEQLRSRVADARYVFIAPPLLEELTKRLRARGTESERQIALRIAHARNELRCAPGLYDEIVVNDVLATTVERLLDIVAVSAADDAAHPAPAPGAALRDAARPNPSLTWRESG